MKIENFIKICKKWEKIKGRKIEKRRELDGLKIKRGGEKDDR